MIPVINLVKSLRTALRDMQGASISDFELIEAINQATSLLYGQMSEKFVGYGIKRKVLITDTASSTPLPKDFVRVHQVGMENGDFAIPTTYIANVYGTYRIIGETFYAPEGAYSLEYYYTPERVHALDDTLDVPTAMSPYIEQISLALYGNNLEKAMQIVQTCSQGLGAREVSHFENVGPVQVLGGRI